MNEVEGKRMMLLESREFAYEAHANQKRKDGETPYTEHLEKTVWNLKECEYVPEEVLAAAYLHDIIEDTSIQRSSLEMRFGAVVAAFVWEVTNRFTKENFPLLNRDKRKQLERERLAACGPWTQTLKLADRLANLQDDLQDFSENFRRIYLDESRKLLEALTLADNTVRENLRAEIDRLNNAIQRDSP
jgi:(p)ppGpp synthase/HD superfamily hydrolase